MNTSADTRNKISMLLFTALLGAFTGLVIWCFLKAVGVCTSLAWTRMPEATGQRWLVIPLCALGGLVVGVLHRVFGDYPDSLDVVMKRIKQEKHYDYHPMFVMLVCAFIPLVFGASVGPEAGLTGIIAALCYWVGDNVTYAKQNAETFSQVGEAVTLGQLFHSPLFGILAVEEKEDESGNAFSPMPKGWKLVLYGLSTAASLLVIGLLNKLFGKAMAGFPSFDEVIISQTDYWMLLVYIPVGVVLCVLFERCEKALHGAAQRVPVILREAACGLCIGVMSLLVPMVLFSGEEQMAELMADMGSVAPLVLIGVCLLKLVMTAFCLNFGMKGGHFFPVIFACTCMGMGISGLLFADMASHAAFAAGAVTAAMLGAQMKKPLAVSMLLLLCFPARFLFWLFLCAALGSGIAHVAEKLLAKRTAG